ncbi:copper amine oxidase N-terminal domain-containing protein [Fenollaria timonensis]|uniref:copper amine oxidase N-terminal domain-containing protein n=1 Tax=Fenollaria timonensis TaxID=1723384 RepID=UPI00071CB2EB|nr:copper amine oxidase N-terminal domain-containing protein [Fenollaria timonensis]
MKAKKILLSTIIATQVLTATVLAAPDEAIKEFNKVAPIKQEVKHFQGEVKLFIIKDGEKVRVDQKMTDGLRVVNGRTCVGVRDLVNAIEGADVEWDGTNHIVDITYAGKTISYPVGKPLMWADGKAVSIDVPAQIDPAISKTFLPIRNIAETLGFKVDWDNKAKEVVLTPGAKQTTTAQQARPTTQTPTQNKNLAWVTASGQRIPKPEELPTARYQKNKFPVEGTVYNINLKEEDITDNNDGSITYFKGTVIEYTSGVPFKKVDTIGQRPSNWSIFKENKNDIRVGTAIVTKGNSDYDNLFKFRRDKALGKTNDPYKPYNISFLSDYLTKEYITEIDKANFKNQLKDINKEKTTKDTLDKMNFIANGSMRVFDATGVFDISIKSIYKRFGSEYGLTFNLNNPVYYITTEGGVVDRFFVSDYVKRFGNFTIDKIIIDDMAKYIVDITNINYLDYAKNNISYESNNFSVGDHGSVLSN